MISQRIRHYQLIMSAHSGAMVSLRVPDKVRDQLKDLGLLSASGVEPDNLHITLLYLGPADQINDVKRQQIVAALNKVSNDHAPFEVHIGGFGQFMPGPDGTPLIANIDAKGLSALQADIERQVEEGFELPSEHGFTPHMTMGYLPKGKKWTPPTVDRKKLPSWTADRFELVMADKIHAEFVLSAARQASPSPQPRPNLIMVYQSNPPWHKKREQGWWFTGTMDADTEDVFKSLTWYHRGPQESIYRFYRWSEQGWTGWWTASKSVAASAHKILKQKGWDLEYVRGLPFEREFKEWTPPDPAKERWYGDYDVARRGILLLLNNPDIKERDLARLNLYWDAINKKHWISKSQVENLRKIMRRPRNLKWLKQKGYTRRVMAAIMEDPMSRKADDIIKRVLARNPACCREAALLEAAQDLAKAGDHRASQEVADLVQRMNEVQEVRAKAGKESKHLKGFPEGIDKYYEGCIKKKGSDKVAKASCAKIAKTIYCTHVNPKWKACGGSR